MTREEAIAYGNDYYTDLISACCKIDEKHKEFVRMAIKALEQEPCEDAISRRAVLDLIEHYNSDGLGSVFYGYEEGLKFANAVNKLPSVNSQEPKWIPVSERLPESDGSYLFFGKVVEDDAEDIFIGMYDACAEKFGYWEDYYDRSTLGFLDSELIEYNKVIAWMPLPEPYKAESEK